MEAVKSQYYDPSSEVNFGSLKKLKDKFKNRVSEEDLFNFLLGQRSYTAFKPQAKKHFMRRSVSYRRPFEIVAADLGDLNALKKFNKGHGWLFLAIDIFSKFIFLEAAETKGKTDMLQCFEKLVKSVPDEFKIEKIWSDEGECALLHVYVPLYVCLSVRRLVASVLSVLSLCFFRFRIHELQEHSDGKIWHISLFD